MLTIHLTLPTNFLIRIMDTFSQDMGVGLDSLHVLVQNAFFRVMSSEALRCQINGIHLKKDKFFHSRVKILRSLVHHNVADEVQSERSFCIVVHHQHRSRSSKLLRTRKKLLFRCTLDDSLSVLRQALQSGASSSPVPFSCQEFSDGERNILQREFLTKEIFEVVDKTLCEHPELCKEYYARIYHALDLWQRILSPSSSNNERACRDKSRCRASVEGCTFSFYRFDSAKDRRGYIVYLTDETYILRWHILLLKWIRQRPPRSGLNTLTCLLKEEQSRLQSSSLTMEQVTARDQRSAIEDTAVLPPSASCEDSSLGLLLYEEDYLQEMVFAPPNVTFAAVYPLPQQIEVTAASIDAKDRTDPDEQRNNFFQTSSTLLGHRNSTQKEHEGRATTTGSRKSLRLQRREPDGRAREPPKTANSTMTQRAAYPRKLQPSDLTSTRRLKESSANSNLKGADESQSGDQSVECDIDCQYFEEEEWSRVGSLAFVDHQSSVLLGSSAVNVADRASDPCSSTIAESFTWTASDPCATMPDSYSIVDIDSDEISTDEETGWHDDQDSDEMDIVEHYSDETVEENAKDAEVVANDDFDATFCCNMGEIEREDDVEEAMARIDDYGDHEEPWWQYNIYTKFSPTTSPAFRKLEAARAYQELLSGSNCTSLLFDLMDETNANPAITLESMEKTEQTLLNNWQVMRKLSFALSSETSTDKQLWQQQPELTFSILFPPFTQSSTPHHLYDPPTEMLQVKSNARDFNTKKKPRKRELSTDRRDVLSRERQRRRRQQLRASKAKELNTMQVAAATATAETRWNAK